MASPTSGGVASEGPTSCSSPTTTWHCPACIPKGPPQTQVPRVTWDHSNTRRHVPGSGAGVQTEIPFWPCLTGEEVWVQIALCVRIMKRPGLQEDSDGSVWTRWQRKMGRKQYH